MAELRRLEKEVNTAMDELEQMLKKERTMTENDKLQVFEDRDHPAPLGMRKRKNGIFRWWMSWLH